jgi:hypothetical protein
MFQIEMPTKVTIELIMDDEGLYESGTSLGTHLTDFQDLAKNFPYVKECNVICIVREGGRREERK